jgi:nucleoid-associated protein EbfC
VEPGGEPNIQQMLQQAQRMQEQLMNLQRELAETEVEGTAGGGLVTATVNGQSELVKLVIDPAAIDTTDPAETAETVADLVLAAIHNAGEEAQRLQENKMGPLTEGLGSLGGGLPGGLGLPEL